MLCVFGSVHFPVAVYYSNLMGMWVGTEDNARIIRFNGLSETTNCFKL